jgi:quinol monooxygenase YgiN
MFYENWESRELWQVHMNNDNLANFIAATDGALESLTVNEMTHIV